MRNFSVPLTCGERCAGAPAECGGARNSVGHYHAAMVYGVATWPRSEEGVTDAPRNSAAAGLLALMTLED